MFSELLWLSKFRFPIKNPSFNYWSWTHLSRNFSSTNVRGSFKGIFLKICTSDIDKINRWIFQKEFKFEKYVNDKYFILLIIHITYYAWQLYKKKVRARETENYIYHPIILIAPFTLLSRTGMTVRPLVRVRDTLARDFTSRDSRGASIPGADLDDDVTSHGNRLILLERNNRGEIGTSFRKGKSSLKSTYKTKLL